MAKGSKGVFAGTAIVAAIKQADAAMGAEVYFLIFIVDGAFAAGAGGF
jgi:hypothetical protein